MKKTTLLILITLAFTAGCQTAGIPQAAANEGSAEIQPTATKSFQREEAQIPQFSIDELTKEKRKEFERVMPREARRFLENAESVKVTIQEKVNEKDKTADLADKELKSKLLNAFYIDIAESIPTNKNAWHVGCISLPTYFIEAENKQRKAKIRINYGVCGKFLLEGDFEADTGFMPGRNARAEKVFAEIMEKYGN